MAYGNKQNRLHSQSESGDESASKLLLYSHNLVDQGSGKNSWCSLCGFS